MAQRLDRHVEVAPGVEDTGFMELELRSVAAPPLVGLDELFVGKPGLR